MRPRGDRQKLISVKVDGSTSMIMICDQDHEIVKMFFDLSNFNGPNHPDSAI